MPESWVLKKGGIDTDIDGYRYTVDSKKLEYGSGMI